MLNQLRGPAIGMFANDDLAGEVRGILLYVIGPLFIGILLVRLCIQIWMSWRGSRWSNASPAAVSTMIGTLLLPVPPIVDGMRHGVHSFEGAMIKLTLGISLAFPILITAGPLLLIYGVRAIHGESNVPSFAVYCLCAGSLAIEYFYLGWFLSH